MYYCSHMNAHGFNHQCVVVWITTSTMYTQTVLGLLYRQI